MTNLEALNSIITFDINPDLLTKTLIDNGIVTSDTYVSANHDSIELCSAFIYKILVTAPNNSQGSYSISNAQAKEFKNLANEIFKKYNREEEIFGASKITLQLL
jgi:hypothetical protein